MKDKELLQMLEVLGRNSRRYSTSLAASEVVAKGDEYGNREGNTKCAKTLRNIIEGQSRSLAASAPTSKSGLFLVLILA